MRSWQVSLAAVLAGLGLLPAAGCFYLAYLAIITPVDLIGFIYAVGATLLATAGLFLVFASISLAIGLLRRRGGARLLATVAGAAAGLTGVVVALVEVRVGLPLVLYGVVLGALMMSTASAADLGPWRQQFATTEPGPRVPPALVLLERFGPDAERWRIWRAGLSQDPRVGELVVLYTTCLVALTGLVAVVLGVVTRASVWSRTGLMSFLLPAALGVLYLLELKLRRRFLT